MKSKAKTKVKTKLQALASTGAKVQTAKKDKLKLTPRTAKGSKRIVVNKRK